MRRIIAITAGLAAAGALLGGIVGALVMAVVVVATGPLTEWKFVTPLFFAALFGGGLGAVLGPLAAWTLMRHVPIWRAMVETAVGTTVGAIAGIVAGRLGAGGPPWVLVAALLGFAAAAIRLRVSQRSPVAR